MTLKGIFVSCAALLLGACASGGPVPTGDGSYYLTKKSAGCGFSGGEGSKADLLREANQFCAGKHQEIQAIDAQAHNGVPFAHCASAELTFKCVVPRAQQKGCKS